jgi:UDPglucose 6-dehydrogenase
LNLTVIGSGHVGLVTGACFAQLGNKVMCIDDNAEKIKSYKNCKITFYKPGLEEIVRENYTEGRLLFSDSIKEGTNFGDIIFVAVGTPRLPSGDADLSAIKKVAVEIAQSMDTYKVIVEKSTIPAGTCQMVRKLMEQHIKPGIEFDVAHNPEFLQEGVSIKSFMKPYRIVLGVDSDRAAGILVKLYDALNAPVLITDIHSAELIKVCANAFLAMKISFINAVSFICDQVGADVEKVAKGIGMDSRIGTGFLNPGAGYGGACFPKDISAFIHLAEKHNYDFALLKEVDNINEFAKKNIINKIKDVFQQNLKEKIITVLGLSFKPNTDDMRKAPSIDIIEMLKDEEAKVRAYDPKAMDNAREIIKGIEYFGNAYEAANGADAIIIVTEWDEFKTLDLMKIKQILRSPVIIDGRNLFEPIRMKSLGFEYRGIGKKLP